MSQTSKPSKTPASQAPKPEPSKDASQSQRFISFAREAGVDETGEAFDRAFGKIVPPKLPEKQDEKSKKKPGH